MGVLIRAQPHDQHGRHDDVTWDGDEDEDQDNGNDRLSPSQLQACLQRSLDGSEDAFVAQTAGDQRRPIQ
jgi:hypothetical protein